MADYIVHKAVEHSALSAKVKAALEQTYQWVLSPKYDGCHAVFLFDEGKHVVTLSRTGEHVQSMPHIASDLLHVYGHLLKSGRRAICGEAWAPGVEFNVISGWFRKQSPVLDLHFVPFDIVEWESNTDTTSFPPVNLGSGVRYLARCTALLDQQGCGYHRIILPRFLHLSGTFSEVLPQAVAYAKEHKQRTDSFFDGAVLAQAAGTYTVGAGKGGEFIKIKPLLSETVKVNALFPDVGERTGKNTLALGFELAGKQQKVSTGLTQEQVDSFIADNKLILGHRIEVEAMGLTVNGLLREPRFKGIRDDA